MAPGSDRSSAAGPLDVATAPRAGDVEAATRGAELSVIVPTINERDNVGPLIDLLDAALAGIAWEVIFVDDDSRDGTPEHVRELARRDPRVRCIQRIGRRGLSTACIEGVLASAAPYVAVMDADLQHDETLLPRMLAVLKTEPVDLVLGSRYIAGGGIGEWDKSRARMSGFATRLSRMICKTDIADPMSGFFMLRREVFEGALRRLSGQGFKILLDLLASSPQPVRVKELPFEFRQRRYGESKLDTLVAWEYMMLIADKLVGHVVPVRFALFALIGGLGLLVHLAVLWLTLTFAAANFTAAQTVATVVAMTSNFFLNNLFTYRDQRLRGWRALRGLLSFYAICSLGAVANVGIASYVFAHDEVWWLAGVAGVIVGSVWNYAVSSVFTWKKK
jgi:dolichol-phosphate mannosyltransferase